MPPTDRVHLENLAIEQLEAIVLVEHARVGHSLELLDGKPFGRNFGHHG